jgi:hypothetical protein
VDNLEQIMIRMERHMYDQIGGQGAQYCRQWPIAAP